jgi:hypothetical protein
VDAVDALDGADTADTSAPVQMAVPANGGGSPSAPAPVSAPAPTAVADPEQVQQMLDATRDIFNRATQQPRWPMYVRQLKQFIRGVDQTFDERKWGFATIMEFLRVCQREGIFRLERDRRGQIRVFPGSGLQTAPAMAPSPAAAEQQVEANGNVYDAEPVETARIESDSLAEFDSGSVRLQPDLSEPPAAEVIEIDEQPAPVKPRRTRKAPTAGKPAARKSTGARTAAPRRRKAPVPAA